jgi:hypothetical protein
MQATGIRGADVNWRRTASVLAAVAAAAGATVAFGWPASAAPAVPAAAAARELFGVSCVTAKNCLAVGVDWNALKRAGGPLAETWNGTTWRMVGVKLPRGATGGILSGVSCESAGRCVAVGSYATGGSSEFALAEIWNGKAWTPAQLPAAGGASTSLDGVSCKSAASCVAVGASQAGDQAGAPLAEIWNGKRWTQTRPPASGSGFAVSGLDAVSCSSPARCVATGVTVGGPPAAVIESWNGKAWSAGQGAAVPGDIGAEQTGVSCPSAGSCAVVGFGMYSTATASFSEIRNGKSWRDASVPLPGGGTDSSHLWGVSCAAVNRCVAVGDIESYLKGATTERTAAVTWNGKAWTVTGVPGPGKGKASLFKDVTCLSAADCVAVGQAGPAGSSNGTGLSGFWNGKSWRLVTAG